MSDGTVREKPASPREQARVAQEQRRAQERRRRRNGWIAAVAGVVVLVVVGVVLLVNAQERSQARADQTGPTNMQSDGVVLISGSSSSITAATTPAIGPGGAPVATQSLREKGIIDVVLYVDYRSPEAATFWKTNQAMLKEWITGGHVTLEVHPVAMLDGTTPTAPAATAAASPAPAAYDGDYSLRAAGAMACVADADPAHAYDVNAALLAAQPTLPTSGLTTTELVALVEKAGATGVAGCIEHGDFTDYVTQATTRAQASVPFENVPALGTPFFSLVGGIPYPGEDGSADQFFAFMAQVYNGILAELQQKAQGTGAPTAPTPGATPAG